MSGPSVRWRTAGHQLQPDTDVLRFEVDDINRVIQRAAADSALGIYRPLLAQQGHPEDWEIFVLSCYAITEEWTPRRLAVDTGFVRYRLARASVLTSGGYELWPTEVYLDGVPDPRNSVHYDLVVALGPGLVPAGLTAGSPAERRAARAELRPMFEQVLALLGDPVELEPPAFPGETDTMNVQEGGAK